MIAGFIEFRKLNNKHNKLFCKGPVGFKLICAKVYGYSLLKLHKKKEPELLFYFIQVKFMPEHRLLQIPAQMIQDSICHE
jgi:hypothetical protein